MLLDHWPPAGLSLTTDRLRLRQPDDAELAALAEVAADGVHAPGERPYLTPWTDLPPAERARYVIQQHWRRRGEWRADSWELEFGVFHEERPIGIVAIRGHDFAIRREVKTESWLGLPHHRRGLGTEARTALLHLAFTGLDAVAAVSEVFQDNAASQGVSRKLGYRPDGISRDVLHGQVATSDRLRLTADDWHGRPRPAVTITGLEPCLPLFGR
ncbi:GNAT family N-acetyltransferase [Actinoplanes sp. NPDC051494]|uniref:GNAT family N-acetyltransferase n=1 Tax=Actinoplanes sp. NPDC051494 TaxID=3363907 RepID=UPI0037B00A6C